MKNKANFLILFLAILCGGILLHIAKPSHVKEHSAIEQMLYDLPKTSWTCRDAGANTAQLICRLLPSGQFVEYDLAGDSLDYANTPLKIRYLGKGEIWFRNGKLASIWDENGKMQKFHFWKIER